MKEITELKAEITALKSGGTAPASGGMTLTESAEEARKKVEETLKKQAVMFDGAGNKNIQQSPLGVPQSWNLKSLDTKKAESNVKTMDSLASIFKEHPELYCECHGSTDADASKPADP